MEECVRLTADGVCTLTTEMTGQPVLVKTFPPTVVQPDVMCLVFSRK
jgi:hypothetical protein